ncbi:SDR family NAD(P)-dependent oxidoreductase [Pedobacter miscanthi]|uniref:Short-chain dehydrogenase n=1 Tax=Pedobacter miscanthi TaxID=2259170 RepID=A0A366L1Y2_9SPHI|nr:SDR family oxidoreductase [Pedobacter miscanthi]RBQ07911.1 short-chain dehydrogenase [Pedobacter miscanthi]
MDFESKKILITGGSSGIGREMVKLLYQKGARDIAIVGRSMEKIDGFLEELPDARLHFLKGDVSNLTDIKNIYIAVKEIWGSLDILINNAGVVSAGPLEEISDEDIIAQQNINITGVILLTKYLLSLLKLTDDAALIFVSSGLGLIGMPFYAPYAASKAAVRQFAESLRRELKAFSIHVMTVYPVATDTPMMQTASTKSMDSPESVAVAAIQGLIDGEIDVKMGGEEILQNQQLNYENPLLFDEKVETMFEAMQVRASGHRSM